MRLLIAYTLVCAVVTLVSCFAGDRRAIVVAVLLCVSHVIGGMAWIYLPAAPATIIHHLGYADFSHTETRAVMDGSIAAWVAYRCTHTWWGIAIWIGLISTGFAHVMRQNFGLDQTAYAYAINGLFLAMAATLLRIGGGGAIQYVGTVLSRCADRYRDILHSARAARQKARGG